jgi:hypothetical protein
MNRKLMALNAALALAVVYAGVQLHGEYVAAKARAEAQKHVAIGPVGVPPYMPLPGEPAVMPSGYNYVVQKFLFHPSRDPNIAVDPPPPPPAPPPPPPMPELPRFHGQMNLGDGPTAILAEHPGTPEKDIKPGETIGQFKLVDINSNEITFQWAYNGEIVRRTLRSLEDSTQVAAAQVSAPTAPVSAPAAPVVMTSGVPGELTGQGIKTCQANDNTPDGTVVDGYRKISRPTPFGKACLWEPVK